MTEGTVWALTPLTQFTYLVVIVGVGVIAEAGVAGDTSRDARKSALVEVG
jgi:hypothetical protein